MGPKRLLSAPEQDAARGEGELAARGTSPTQALPTSRKPPSSPRRPESATREEGAPSLTPTLKGV